MLDTRHPDGKNIITSKVVKKIDILETNSGTIYILDIVSFNYKEWCIECGMELNLEDPVKLMT